MPSLLDLVPNDKKVARYQQILEDVLNKSASWEQTDDNFRDQETIMYKLAEHFVEVNNPIAIQSLIKTQEKVLSNMPKAKSAKIVKNLIEYVAKIPNSTQIQSQMCQELIQWCKDTSRNYLLHRIQLKLVNIYLITDQFQNSLKLIEEILNKIRKSEDKHLLVESYLLESKIHWRLQSNNKSKSSLTACRSNANNIYCKPRLQAEIELMSGILHCEEGDYKTAYSYFYESFENYNSVEAEESLSVLKYMILSKVMINNNDEALQLVNNKYGLKYGGPHIETMRMIIKANKKKNLQEFESTLQSQTQYIHSDPIIKAQLNELYNNLLEQNLFKIIEPYSNIQISYIAEKLQLEVSTIQKKLSELILDKKINGTLDQGYGSLIIFDEIQANKIYQNSIELLEQMDDVIDQISLKSKKIKA